jgi:hypothetical protein
MKGTMNRRGLPGARFPTDTVSRRALLLHGAGALGALGLANCADDDSGAGARPSSGGAGGGHGGSDGGAGGSAGGLGGGGAGGDGTAGNGGGGTSYSTTFDLTENPMLEDGGWIQAGDVAGPSWQNVRTAGGLCFGLGPAVNYEDCTACRADFNNAGHVARGRVHVAPGYQPPSTHEVELVVGVDIAPSSVRLYEWLWSFGGGLQVVRWNGPAADFTLDLPVRGPGVGAAVEGDVMELRYDASDPSQVVLTCLVNDVVVASAVDTTAGRILSGNPGLSFFAREGAGLDMASYCFTEWSCDPL